MAAKLTVSERETLSANQTLTRLAAGLAQIIVPENARDPKQVTFVFRATRDTEGFLIEKIELSFRSKALSLKPDARALSTSRSESGT